MDWYCGTTTHTHTHNMRTRTHARTHTHTLFTFLINWQYALPLNVQPSFSHEFRMVCKQRGCPLSTNIFATEQQWLHRLSAFVPTQFAVLLMLYLLDDQSRDDEQSCLFPYTFSKAYKHCWQWLPALPPSTATRYNKQNTRFKHARNSKWTYTRSIVFSAVCMCCTPWLGITEATR